MVHHTKSATKEKTGSLLSIYTFGLSSTQIHMEYLQEHPQQSTPRHKSQYRAVLRASHKHTSRIPISRRQGLPPLVPHYINDNLRGGAQTGFLSPQSSASCRPRRPRSTPSATMLRSGRRCASSWHKNVSRSQPACLPSARVIWPRCQVAWEVWAFIRRLAAPMVLIGRRG